MYYLRNFFVPSALVLSFITLASSAATAGVIVVGSTVTGTTGAYTYNYTVTNTTPDDPFIIDIPVPKLTTAATNLIAPTGFKIAFDSGLGLVSFLEDTSTFGALPVSGFSFKSPFASGAATFQATTLSFSTGNTYVATGAVTAPVASAVTPEPGYFGLLSLALGVGAFLKLRPLSRS